MSVFRIDEQSRFRQLVGVGGLGTGSFFALEGNHTLGRNESRSGRLLDVRDYCKLHIVIHYIARLLGSASGLFPVVPVGKVGNDAAGEFVVREMRGAGIDTPFVDVVAGKPTLFSVCFQYPDGCGGNMTTSNSAATELSDEDVNRVGSILRSAGPKGIALLVPEVPLTARRRFLELATQAGSFRAASFVSGEVAEAKRLGMFDELDLASLNEEEAAELAGVAFSKSDAENFLGRCRKLIAQIYPNLQMILSIGKNGAYAIDKTDWSYCPAPSVEVASTAGAGDCLLGGILAALAAGIPLKSEQAGRQGKTDRMLETALHFGVLLASYKVTSPHTIHPDASLARVMEFARQRRIAVSPAIERLIAEPTSAGR